MSRGFRALRRAAGLASGSASGVRVAAAAVAAGQQQQTRGVFGLFSAPTPTGPPMTEPLTGLPETVPAPLEAVPPGTKLTVLSNGVRVASEASFGPTATLGVYVDSGRCALACPYPLSNFDPLPTAVLRASPFTNHC